MSAPDSAPVPPPLPAAQFYRRERQLLVQRGSDLSHACLVCAKPPSGGAIVHHIPAARWITHKSTGGGGGSFMLVLDLLEFLVSIVWFVVDFPARRKRIVKIGLCAAHRRNYFLCRRGAWVAAGLTIPLLAVAFFVPLREPWASLTLFVGLPMLFAAIFLPWGAPALRLVSEKAGNMWIVGAGKGFLKLYPDFPARSK